MYKRLLYIGGVLLVVLSSSAIIAEEVAKKERTQGEFAVQLCKALGLEVPAGNYIAQLETQGIMPEGGWQKDKAISNSEMASLLARALGLEKEIKTRAEKKVEEAYRDKATVIRIEGDVTVKLGETGWAPAEIGMKLTQADSIKTGIKSWAELRVGMVGGIRINESSEVHLNELSSSPSGAENIILYMSIGEMLVDVRNIAPDSDFQVRTPTTVAAVRGTVYNVKVAGEMTEILESKE